MRKGRRERWERTGLDCVVDKPPVLFPLYADATGVLPVAGMGLVHFVQRAEPQTVASLGDVLAEGPPDALFACNPALAAAIGPLCVDVYWIYARPSGGGMRRGVRSRRAAYLLYGVMSVMVFEGGLAESGWDWDAEPAVASSGSSELWSSSDAPICSRRGPRGLARRGRAGRGMSVSSSNSSTTAVRRAIVVGVADEV